MIFLSFLFILPAIIVKEGPRLLYAIFVGAIGWAIGKKIVEYIKKRREGKIVRKKVNILISNFAIFVYILIYIILSIIIDFEFFKEEFLLILFKMIFGSFLLYRGLDGVAKKRMFIRMGYLKDNAAIVVGVLGIFIALLILFAVPIFKVYFMLR